jgi:hypothetical protein
MLLDRRLLVEIGIGQHATLLQQDAREMPSGIEAVAREIALHWIVPVPFPWISLITEYTCPLAEVSDGTVGAGTPGQADEFDDGEVDGDPISAMSPQFHLAPQK